MTGIGYRHQKPGQTSYSAGQVSSEPLTWTSGTKVTVGAASGTLVAAGTGAGRLVVLKVPSTATTGIHIRKDGGVATTSYMFVEPGEVREISTEQAITAIRGGGSDVDVYFDVGVVA